MDRKNEIIKQRTRATTSVTDEIKTICGTLYVTVGFLDNEKRIPWHIDISLNYSSRQSFQANNCCEQLLKSISNLMSLYLRSKVTSCSHFDMHPLLSSLDVNVCLSDVNCISGVRATLEKYLK